MRRNDVQAWLDSLVLLPSQCPEPLNPGGLRVTETPWVFNTAYITHTSVKRSSTFNDVTSITTSAGDDMPFYHQARGSVTIK